MTNGEIPSLVESAGVPECDCPGSFGRECPLLPSFLPPPYVPCLMAALCFLRQFELDFFFIGKRKVCE